MLTCMKGNVFSNVPSVCWYFIEEFKLTLPDLPSLEQRHFIRYTEVTLQDWTQHPLESMTEFPMVLEQFYLQSSPD